MDLYLTINLTENLQNAREKRRKQRIMEEQSEKMVRIQSFVE
jgi:hypothetical protein